MPNDDMKNRSLQYFEGHATIEDELKLFQWINEDADHQRLFRQWEQQWASNHDADLNTLSAWQQVKSRTISPLRRSRRQRRLRWLSAAAAVLVLMTLSAVTAWMVSNNRSEQLFAVSAPLGSKTRVVLPDSSVVWLNAGSTLHYGSEFNRRDRNVSLEGQGYFEVRHKQDNREFTVHTDGYDIVVKGTQFTVSAYNDDPTVTTSLLQGSVRIDTKDGQMMMVPGETVTMDRKTGQLTKTSQKGQAIWRGSSADYGDITLGAFAKIMERQYDIDIDIRSARLRNTILSISITNDMRLPDLLQALRQVTGMKVERNGRKVIISE